MPEEDRSPAPLSYARPEPSDGPLPQSRFGIVSLVVFGLLCAWSVWGFFQILKAFYGGPGIPGRSWLWWIVFFDVGGVTIASAGFVLGAIGLLDRGKGLATAVMGVSGNAVGLILYARDLIRQL